MSSSVVGTWSCCYHSTNPRLEAWAGALPTEDSDLLDPTAGLPLRWSANQGWQEPVS